MQTRDKGKGLHNSGLSKRLRVTVEVGKVTGDFLIFVFLLLIKLSYACSEKPAHLSE